MFFQKKPDIDEVVEGSIDVLQDVEDFGKKIVDNGVKPEEIADFDLVSNNFEKYTQKQRLKCLNTTQTSF